MDPKKMADLLSRNLTLSTENVAPPGGKFKISNYSFNKHQIKTYSWLSH